MTSLQFPELPARLDYVDAVYQVLGDAIADGSLAPGMRITQEQLAEQFKVSRSPVLQAIRLLKKDGLLHDAPGRGIMVAPLSVTNIAHLYSVRGALDGLAAKLAATRRVVIDPELLIVGRRVAHGSDLKAIIDADLAFHSAIYRASGNPLIEESAQLHWVHLRRAMGAVLRISTQRKSLWDEHEAIAKAIAKGDAPRAAELAERHCHNASTNILRQLTEARTTPNAEKDLQIAV